MEQRINIFEKGMPALKTLFSIGAYLKNATLEPQLVELVLFRVSQINGCAYCLDMHSKEARAHGESEQRLYSVSAWRETPYYNERERAALAWAEALTRCEVTDNVYKAVTGPFSEQEIIDLTLTITTINTWNRINLAFPQEAGTYKVGMFG
jgi:AhpD family alkylhydroperoxidase